MDRVLIAKSVWFEALWLLAVVGRESTELLLAILVVGTLVFSVRKEGFPWRWLGAFFMVGYLLDSINIAVGLYQFDNVWIPLWLVMLWLIFLWYGFQLRAILIRYPVMVVSMVSAIGAALSYYAGVKLGAVTWPYGATTTLPIIVLEWFVLMMVLVRSLVYQSRKQASKTSLEQCRDKAKLH